MRQAQSNVACDMPLGSNRLGIDVAADALAGETCMDAYVVPALANDSVTGR